MTDRVCGTCGAQPCRCPLTSGGSQGWIPPYSIQMYGGAPDPTMWPPPRVEPPLPPGITVGGSSKITIVVDSDDDAQPRKVTAAARVDADGKLHLRISVDGVAVVETDTDGTTATLTVDVE